MHINANGQMIGRGEETTLKILREIYPYAEFKIQVPISKVITNPEELENMSIENKKRTLDIYFETGQAKFAVRVQNGGKTSKFNKGNHTSWGRSRIDMIQKRDLESNGIYVVDVNERDCPNIFAEKYNEDSKKEIMYCLRSRNIFA